jgi:NAD(P)-dependent dehydrogenase (short-subunit alcohol dehydrogenase family)
MGRLRDCVALVTGASRGAGRGIAVALGAEGATVYVTGRSVRGAPTTLGRPGTIDETAEEIGARGGTGIAVRCDHTVDADVDAVFARIRADQGRLDLLVNNAWSGYELAPDPALPFWEIECGIGI